MIAVRGYAALSEKTPLAPYDFERRDLGAHDVLVEILYCGICHSDLHQARNEWGGSTFPMVPGHEIVGRVKTLGSKATRFKAGELVGVGCFTDSCRKCASCKEGEESYCEGGIVFTYNSLEKDGKTPTQGGYSQRIVVDENYVLRIPEGIAPEKAAPLLCAGITTWSPLKHWKVGPGSRVGIVGLGGLGHMGVQLAAALGADVTVLGSSPSKRGDALSLGASAWADSREPETFARMAGKFDLIIDTVSAPHDLNAYLGLLKRDGTLVIVGVPDQPAAVHAFSLIGGRKRLAGSLIGGIRETQEMLDFCGKNRIGAQVEVIPAQRINEAYDRMAQSQVKYRFVVDMGSLK